MPRDYAKNKPRKEPLPGWVWMLGGLFIGLVIAMLAYLYENTTHKQKTLVTHVMKKSITEAAKKTASSTTTDAVKENNNDKPRPKFDFYTILPELEVAIPDNELAQDKKAIEKSKAAQQIDYMLQAGSFRKFDQADGLRAQLVLSGIEAHIQTVKINDEVTWHRVRIGPLRTIRHLDQTRRRLQDLGIASIAVRNKPGK